MTHNTTHNARIAAALAAILVVTPALAGCGNVTSDGQGESAGANAQASEAQAIPYDEQRAALLVQSPPTEQLSPDEQRVSDQLEAMKSEADVLFGNVAYGVDDWGEQASDQSRLHRFMEAMPKGGDLHAHGIELLSFDALMGVLLARDDVLVCLDEGADYGKLYVAGTEGVPEGAQPLKEALGIREQGPDQGEDEAFGYEEEPPALTTETLRDLLTMRGGTDSSTAWTNLSTLLSRTYGLHASAGLLTRLYEAGLRERCDDGASLVEVRLLMSASDEQNATELGALRDAYYAVKRDYPNLVVRVIGCASKGQGTSTEDACGALRSVIRLSAQIRDESDSHNPRNFVVGLDLTGDEDTSHPLSEYVDFLSSKEVTESGLHLLLHCGESLRVNNESVADAYLLKATRIAHGLNLYRYPDLMEAYKSSQVAIEVCPISNYRMGYTNDLRFHPGQIYLRNGNPMVLASDDALFQEPCPLTDDFFAAALCWDLSLSEIKSLCRNSITYSGLFQEETGRLMAAWESDWNAFIAAQ